MDGTAAGMQRGWLNLHDGIVLCAFTKLQSGLSTSDAWVFVQVSKGRGARLFGSERWTERGVSG